MDTSVQFPLCPLSRSLKLGNEKPHTSHLLKYFIESVFASGAGCSHKPVNVPHLVPCAIQLSHIIIVFIWDEPFFFEFIQDGWRIGHSLNQSCPMAVHEMLTWGSHGKQTNIRSFNDQMLKFLIKTFLKSMFKQRVAMMFVQSHNKSSYHFSISFFYLPDDQRFDFGSHLRKNTGQIAD